MIHARWRGHYPLKCVRCWEIPRERKRSNCSRFLFVFVKLIFIILNTKTMKKQLITLIVVLMSIFVSIASAHDIEVPNADGVSICYNWISDKTELAVTFRGAYYYASKVRYSGDIVIPEEVMYEGSTYKVTLIGDQAFYGDGGLTSVEIPNSVTSIGNEAFGYCSGLTTVDIPSSVTSIGKYAFANCNDLVSIIIPQSVTSIGNDAFSNTAWYDSQPDGLLYAGCVVYKYKGTMPEDTKIVLKEEASGIADYAFFECKGLTSIIIPNHVSIIGNNAFAYCVGLSELKIGESVITIGECAFNECSSLTSVAIPDGVTSIGDRAFQNCWHMESITIPNSVTFIGDVAFYGCFRLTSISIPHKITSIGYFTFSSCRSLTSLIIPNSVTSIGENAFSDCWSLTSLVIPNSVTSIGKNAFSSCRGVTDVICRAKNVPYISSDAFDDSNIANATLHVPSGSIEAYKSDESWSWFKEIVALSDEVVKGDANDDGTINAADIVEVVNFIMGSSSEEFNEDSADANGDGSVNAADIVTIVNIIMGK